METNQNVRGPDFVLIMSLYAADLFDKAELVATKDNKKGKGPMTEDPKPKREMTEKQKAALLKASETRKRKREEAMKAKADAEETKKKEQEDAAAKDEAIKAKKEAQKEKRRLAREAKKQLTTPPESTTDADGSTAHDAEIGEPAPKKKRARAEKPPAKTEDPADPPAWFKKYVASVKKEENATRHPKKKAKEVAHEAEEVAHKQWGDGLIRDRLRNEVDGHMNRMYSMIFNNRRLH